MTTYSYHAASVNDVIKKLGANDNRGLDSDTVRSRLNSYGRNQLPQATRRSYMSIFLGQFLSPLIYLLLLAAGIAFFIGEGKDSVVILVVVFLNAVIGSFQEGRAEQSLEALRKLSKLQARVIRDGQEQLVEASEVVPGDILVLAAGDAVPADARIVNSSQVMAAEAALTGESLPIEKVADKIPEDTVLADRRNMIYAGTYIHSGRCLAVVVATGVANEIGKIAKLASTAVQPKTQLELRIDGFGRQLIYASIFLCLLVVSIGYLRGIPAAEIFMVALSQMVSLVPEGLPVAMTIALAVGVQRMAKRGTVVRRLSAVEALGSTTVICTDKTGTLTRNEMTVTNIYIPFNDKNILVTGVGYDPDGFFLHGDQEINPMEDNVLSRLKLACVLCNDAQLIPPDAANSPWKILGDPTEGALLTLSAKAGLDIQEKRRNYPRLAEIPFDSSVKMMATQNQVDRESIVFIKGAPDILLDYCNEFVTDAGEESLSDLTKAKIQSAANKMADSALRVLAFAYVKSIPIDQKFGFKTFYKEATFVGLVGQIDPPRSEVAQAVLESQEAGIRTVMVTGDHKATGVAIARSLGITQGQDLAIDGKELEALSDAALEDIIGKVSVFARVHPAQKLRIVETFQNKGHVVTMTGDGVNDSPALVKADVGVAMGITGTEVAKEASKIVITDDNFATIVAAVAEGRLVYQNIKKLVLYLFSTSISEVIVLLLALISGFPPPLAAVQILWINLVTEGTLTVNLVMEPAEGHEMIAPPIPSSQPLLDRSIFARMPLMVISITASTFGWFLFRTGQGAGSAIVQSETLSVLAVCQWFNVLNCRSSIRSSFSFDLFKNQWLIGGLILGNVLHFAVIYWEPLSRLFRTVPIAPAQFFAIGVVASLVLWAEEVRKLIIRRKLRCNTR
jgi:magnesium-transporting ATPase (P-type)